MKSSRQAFELHPADFRQDKEKPMAVRSSNIVAARGKAPLVQQQASQILTVEQLSRTLSEPLSVPEEWTR